MASSSYCHNNIVTKKYDVFISFRGTDVRQGLLSHLRTELSHKHIYAYVDDEGLDKGDEISASLLKAIEDSHISLVIFSKDYASSKWCLEELAKIIQCKDLNKQIVLPVFFHVDPSYVRHQRGDYGEAFVKHKEKEDVLKVQSWRNALERAAEFSGFHYPTTYYKNESDLIQEIVEVILKESSKFCASELNGLVGIDQSVEQIKSLLSMESSEVLLVGIWGMGGIGKTTIARAIFDKYCAQFDGCCFLNVREELEQRGLSLLREKLISELLEGEGLHASSKNNYAIRRIGQKNILVVLDDVNTTEQLRPLLGEGISFGAGSRVIITSRDKHVLTSGGVHQIHKVKEMDPPDSLKLFCLNAFNESQPKMGYEMLSEEALKIAHGNPLALKILGSYFHSKSVDIWKCALSKIKKYPNEKIQSVLRFSYDGLDEVEKKAFLDIAFFFKDDDKDYVIRQLNAWGFHGTSGIDVLQQKALITISLDNIIKMHDLIQEMGWEIVRQESVKYPGKGTRLRDNEVNVVLRGNLGINEVEAMQIDVSQIKDLHGTMHNLKRMPQLRFLKFHLPLHSQAELSIPPNPALFWSPEIQDELLSSDWCKKLMSVASEIHIKCHDYLLFDGCSDPSLPSSIEISRCENIGHPGVKMIMNSSSGHLDDIECSDVDYQQLKNLPNDLLCFRCTYYLTFSKSILQQHTKKPKQCNLFHGLRNWLKLSKSTGQEPRKHELHILFDGLRHYRRIPVSKIYDSDAVVVRNFGGFSWVQEFRMEGGEGFWTKGVGIRIIDDGFRIMDHKKREFRSNSVMFRIVDHKKSVDSLVLYQLSHDIAKNSTL